MPFANPGLLAAACREHLTEMAIILQNVHPEDDRLEGAFIALLAPYYESYRRKEKADQQAVIMAWAGCYIAAEILRRIDNVQPSPSPTPSPTPDHPLR